MIPAQAFTNDELAEAMEWIVSLKSPMNASKLKIAVMLLDEWFMREKAERFSHEQDVVHA